MEEIIEQLKLKLGNSPDFVYKKLKVGNQSFYLIFTEVLTNTSGINDFILKNISYILDQPIEGDIETFFMQYLPDHNIKSVSSIDKMLFFLLNGFCILLFENKKALAIEVRANLFRSIGEATNEPVIQGPKDSFIENFNTNLGLIRRRIKSEHLWVKERQIGTLSKTKIGLLYMNNIIEKETLEAIEAKLDNIQIDGIIDSGYLKDRLEEDENNFFPTVLSTERPDRVSMALLEGKIAILVDNSPYVLIVPSFFVDFFHTPDDYYQKPINITFIRIIRLLAFLIAILVPAYYIAVTTHNHDAIPLNLIINFTIQRESVPFPALIEALAMSITFEILRESDTRMPSNMGTAVSILGGLVLGDAAVSAGIISPIMIIVIAISAISGLMFSSIELISAIRWWRIIMMLIATFFGIYGIFLGSIFLIIKLAGLSSFGKPYLAPFAPIILSEQKDALVKIKQKGIKKRNPLLTRKNKIRGR